MAFANRKQKFRLIRSYKEAGDCQRLVNLSLYINHSLEKAWVNSMSCYTNSRMKHNFLLQCSQSQCTSLEPPVSEMHSVGAVAFPASVELTFSPLLPVDFVGNTGDSRNISIEEKKLKEGEFEVGFLNTVGFHIYSLILYCWELTLKPGVTEAE